MSIEGCLINIASRLLFGISSIPKLTSNAIHLSVIFSKDFGSGSKISSTLEKFKVACVELGLYGKQNSTSIQPVASLLN